MIVRVLAISAGILEAMGLAAFAAFQAESSLQLWIWIATTAVGLLLAGVLVLLKRTGEFHTFMIETRTALLGFEKSGGMIQKVDLLVEESKTLEPKLEANRHKMRNELSPMRLDLDKEIREGDLELHKRLDKLELLVERYHGRP